MVQFVHFGKYFGHENDQFITCWKQVTWDWIQADLTYVKKWIAKTHKIHFSILHFKLSANTFDFLLCFHSITL